MIFGFVCLTFLRFCSCITEKILEEDHEGSHRLVDKLFSGYDPGLRPNSAKNGTNITVAFQVQQLLDVNQVHKTIRVIAWLEAHWYDLHLRWDPASYGDTEVFRYPNEKIWKPDLMLINTPDLNEGLVMNKASTYAIIYHYGMVVLAYTAIYEATCPNLTATMFPFDEFTCYLEFGSWTYSGNEVDLNWMNPNATESTSLRPHSEWNINQTNAEKIVELECCPLEFYPIVRVYVHLKRMPLYYIYNLVIPVYIICNVAFIGMFSPSTAHGERIEKVTLGITTLLSMSILMLTISSAMPVTSNEIPIMSAYYGLFLVFIALATISTTFVIQIEAKGLDGRPVPDWARKWLLETIGSWLQCKFIDKKSKKRTITPLTNQTIISEINGQLYSNDSSSAKFKPHPTTPGMELKNLQDFYEENIMKLLNVIHLLRNIDEKLHKEDERRTNHHDWHRLTKVLDRLLMIIFLTISTVLTIVLMTHWT